jgi:hypothetical protein
MMDIVAHLTDNNTEPLREHFRTSAEHTNHLIEFEYRFQFNGVQVRYEYGTIIMEAPVYERLYIDNQVIVFCDHKNDTLRIDLPGTEKLSKDLSLIKIAVLKYIKSNAVIEDKRLSEILEQFHQFINGMLMFWNLDEKRYVGYKTGREKIAKGIVQEGHFEAFKEALKQAELPSNISYTSLDEQFWLDFKDAVSGNVMTVEFFSNASTGMKSFALLYYWMQFVRFGEKPPSLIYMDEFDAFYHERLAQFIVNEIKKHTNTQFILTTHDTSIMSNDILRPDCLFLMYPNRIVSVAEAVKPTGRELRHAHDIEKMYRAGAFDG